MSDSDPGALLCDKCETEYSTENGSCPNCGSKMTRPDFVVDSSYIRDAPPLLAQVSEGFNDGDPRRLQITMMKPSDEPGKPPTWPTISFTNPEIFQKTLSSIQELYSTTGWDARSELLEDLSEDHDDQEKVRQILSQYPSFFNDVLDTVDFERMGEEDVGFLMTAIENLNNTVLQAEQQIQDSFLSLLDSLSGEDDRGVAELADLLEEWHALQVTSTSSVLMRRLQFLQTFEDMIHNDDVYEIRGDQSIHRSLENNLWLINENFWLMQSDRSLRRFVQEGMEEELRDEDEDEAYRRPDFVCATQDQHLVMAEIKRPSHTLQREDVQQLQDYLYYANRYSGAEFEPVDGFLIGNEYDDRAEHAAEDSTNIQIRTYQDLLSDARHRYREYWDELERSDAPEPPSTFDPDALA